MDFLSLVQARYSCKAYTDTPIDDQQLAAVLEAGRLAPTAKNSQPQRIYVLKSSDALAKIDEITPCRYGAPIVLIVCYDVDAVFHYPQSPKDSGAEDVAIVTTHMMLAAANEGLGSCWINFFNPEQAQQIFDLPKQQVPVALLDLGHAAANGTPLKNHESRKPLSETVTYL